MKYSNPIRHKNPQELLSRIIILLEVFRHPNSNEFWFKIYCLALLAWRKTPQTIPMQCNHATCMVLFLGRKWQRIELCTHNVCRLFGRYLLFGSSFSTHVFYSALQRFSGARPQIFKDNQTFTGKIEILLSLGEIGSYFFIEHP